MYTITDYGWMIADERRTNAYAEAIARAVRPGSVVIDIGTGTGVFALLACRAGARKVYAIDYTGLVGIAAEVARENGFEDRVTAIRGHSAEVTLPEQADVIVSDLHGILPLAHDSLGALIDARDRLLVPGGVMIPGREVIAVAIVESEREYRHFSGPWDQQPFGFRMEAARRASMNAWAVSRLGPEALLSVAVPCITIDYHTASSPDVGGSVVASIERDGTAHGFVAWFDSELVPGVTFTNAPSEPRLIYGRAFFPFEQPVPVTRGDEVQVQLRTKLVERLYMWSWHTRVVRGNEVRAEFAQSTFFSELTASK